MTRSWAWSLVVLCGVAALAAAQGGRQTRPYGGYRYNPRYGYTRKLSQLSIAELRQLGLSDQQIHTVAEKRRDVERQRQAIETRLAAAREATRAANAEANRIQAELTTLTNETLESAIRSAMTDEQLKRWEHKRRLDRAKSWLRSYSYSLKLTDAQKEDIAALLVPIFTKQDGLADAIAAAQEHLDTLRRADKLDIQAIDQAEKRLAELQEQNITTARTKALLEAMRAGLLPEQLDTFNQRYRYYMKMKP